MPTHKLRELPARGTGLPFVGAADVTGLVWDAEPDEFREIIRGGSLVHALGMPDPRLDDLQVPAWNFRHSSYQL